jgi:lysophospholipase L1-like esterase
MTLVVALTAALSASRATAAARVPTHVACVGDSITYGYAASSSAAAYPTVLQTLMGSSVKVSNFGHSGATMMSVADQPYQNTTEYTSATTFVSGAGTSAVVDVIIMLGTNDSKSYNWMVGTGTRAAQFVTDCGAMVDHFASLSTHPLVYLAFPPRAFTNTYGIDGTIIHDQMLPLIQQVATAKGVPIIDVDTPTAPHPELFPDGVHPNDTGYMLVAQVMYDGLMQSSAGGQGGHAGTGGQSGQGGHAGNAGTGGQGGHAGNGGQSGQGGHAGNAGTGGQGGHAGASGGGGVSGGGMGGTGTGTGGTGTGTGGSATGGTGAGTGGTGAGTGGTGTGTGGSATGGTGGTGTGTGGTGTGGTGTVTGGGAAGSDAGNAPSSGGGCSCNLSAGGLGESGGAGLLLAAIALFSPRVRPRRRGGRSR